MDANKFFIRIIVSLLVIITFGSKTVIGQETKFIIDDELNNLLIFRTDAYYKIAKPGSRIKIWLKNSRQPITGVFFIVDDASIKFESYTLNYDQIYLRDIRKIKPKASKQKQFKKSLLFFIGGVFAATVIYVSVRDVE